MSLQPLRLKALGEIGRIINLTGIRVGLLLSFICNFCVSLSLSSSAASLLLLPLSLLLSLPPFLLFVLEMRSQKPAFSLIGSQA